MARPKGIADADLDHVAVAVERQADVWPRYVGDLGGVWVGAGRTDGFASAQVRFPDPERSMKVEALEPHRVGANDFLRRFLDHNGEGPHHLTFKVPRIRRALSAAEAHGFEPVGVDLRDPRWKEAFLHPKQACGIVVQLAESDGEEWDEPSPPDLPRSRVNHPAVLSRVELLVADAAAADNLFIGLLGGNCAKTSLYATAEGGPTDGGGFEVTWPGGGRLQITCPEPGTSEAEWLGDRPGRLHHLHFRVESPAEVAGAVALGDGRYAVAAEANHGVRLILSPAPA